MRCTTAFPITEAALLNFLAFKYQSGCGEASLKLFVQALRHQHVLGHSVSCFQSPRVQLLIQGASRSSRKPPHPRDPATLNDLQTVWDYVERIGMPKVDCCMLKSAFSLAFHGLLRVGEYASTAGAPKLLREHVRIQAASIDLTLVGTKTHQLGSEQVTIQQSGTSVCPHAALSAYLVLRGDHHGPLFKFANGEWLKAATINRILGLAVPGKHLRSHSLRIGAASLAGLHSAPDYAVKRAGRWRSSAYHRYVRSLPGQDAIPAKWFQ